MRSDADAVRFRLDSSAETGFGLAEFTISSFILLAISASIFAMLSQTQRSASYQTEVQSVLENTRIAVEVAERHIRQAGNNPLGIAGFDGITITSPTELRLRTDVTGSLSGSGQPDKGDPDGDTNDSGEDVTLRYNAGNQSLELIPGAGTAQSVANYLSNFSMQYFDAAGAPTTVGADVRRVSISITGTSSQPNPETHQVFGLQLSTDIQIATRQ